MKMEYQYKFGFGGIIEVSKGEVDKEDSIDSLDLNESSGMIIIPKLIGVYQEVKEGKEIQNLTDALDQLGVFLSTGEIENIDPSLICLAYDQTIISKSLVEKCIHGDKIKRLKYVEYSNLPDLPDFYEKNPPDSFVLDRGFNDLNTKQLNENNITVLKRNKNVLEMLREDYGLTRYEAIDLTIIDHLLNKMEGNKLISDPFLLRLYKNVIDSNDKIEFGKKSSDVR